MMTTIKLSALALAAAAFTLTALNGVEAARLMSKPVAIARVAAPAHFAGFKLAPPHYVSLVGHTASGTHKPPPPPGCYPRADCQGNGNHGPVSPVNGGYGVNEGGPGQNNGGLDGWDGGGTGVLCFSDIRPCHQPQ